MHLHEFARRDAVLAEKLGDFALRRCARHEDEAAVRLVGIDADAAQRVEVLLDDVALGARRQAVEVREVAPPGASALFAFARDRVARPQKARERQAARMLGQVHEKVVVARAQVAAGASIRRALA